MKVSPQIVLLISILFNAFLSNSSLASEESIDADFLDFLVEMEESTGDGFYRWLDDENVDLSISTSTQIENTDEKLQSNHNDNN